MFLKRICKKKSNGLTGCFSVFGEYRIFFRKKIKNDAHDFYFS